MTTLRFRFGLISAVILLTVVGSTAAAAQSTPTADGATLFALPGDRVFPEGVAYDEETGDFYVGSAADGTIFRGNLESGAIDVFSPAGANRRTSAIGMELDDGGCLFVAGGSTGRIFAYNTETGSIVAGSATGLAPDTFLNDVAIGPDGSAYITDSINPFLFRVPPCNSSSFGFETFVNFTGTPLEYQEGFNANGIVATPDGNALLVVQSNTGKLYRIDLATKAVREVDLDGALLIGGDGMVLAGQTLYVVTGDGTIVPVELADGFATGIAGEGFSDPSLATPTTIALVDDHLLVVNSQFDQMDGEPELPFTLSLIPIPEQALPGTPEP
jgi:Cu-Zn family superoxide dismutase